VGGSAYRPANGAVGQKWTATLLSSAWGWDLPAKCEGQARRLPNWHAGSVPYDKRQACATGHRLGALLKRAVLCHWPQVRGPALLMQARRPPGWHARSVPYDGGQACAPRRRPTAGPSGMALPSPTGWQSHWGLVRQAPLDCARGKQGRPVLLATGWEPVPLVQARRPPEAGRPALPGDLRYWHAGSVPYDGGMAGWWQEQGSYPTKRVGGGCDETASDSARSDQRDRRRY